MTDPKDPLAKYRAKTDKANGEDEPAADFSQDSDKTYFAYRPGNKMRRLIVRPLNDAHRAPTYSYLVDIVWDADRGESINLIFSYATFRIKGKNLQDLAQQLAREKVIFIQAFDPAKWARPEQDEPIINSIEIRLSGSEPQSGEGKKEEKKP